MGMGGGGGAAPPAGLSPLQQANFGIGKNMVRGGANSIGAMQDARQYGMQMSNLAQGGLLSRGMGQLQTAMNQSQNLAPGMQARMAGRMGVAADPEQMAALQQQQALSSASTRVGLTNQTRAGLVNAQRDMRFSGIQI